MMKREIKIFKTFEEMEANQLLNMAKLSPEERMSRAFAMQKNAVKHIEKGPRKIIIHKNFKLGY